MLKMRRWEQGRNEFREEVHAVVTMLEDRSELGAYRVFLVVPLLKHPLAEQMIRNIGSDGDYNPR